MTTRTDTERLDWFEVPGNRNAVRFIADGGAPWQTRDGQGFQTFRAAINAAMEAFAAKELDEAWAWFRTSGFQLVESPTEPGDWAAIAPAVKSCGGFYGTADYAILAAYRASKKV